VSRWSVWFLFLCTAGSTIGCPSHEVESALDAGIVGDSGPVVPVDQDNDGVSEAQDCDDQNDQLGARAQDGDCDGHLLADDCDDGNPASTHRGEDADCDGYLPPDDCDDTNPAIYPGAEEDWGDGVDQDCDGNKDSVCGDARLGNIETCDDANVIDGDGCSSTCAIEPQCTQGCLADTDCQGADERCIGVPSDLDAATGQCENINVTLDGIETPCGLENPCPEGLVCLGAYAWAEGGWCVPDWFAKDFYSHDLAPLPEDGSRYSSSVVACGLASVPVDIVVELHLSHPRPEDLIIELEDPNGQVGTVLDRQAWQSGPIVARVGSGDDQVNGRWTLHLRDTVSGETGVLTGWSLYLLSRWD
jgi:cysteine-rich repeat protein